jgi:hypothetical protein
VRVRVSSEAAYRVRVQDKSEAAYRVRVQNKSEANYLVLQSELFGFLRAGKQRGHLLCSLLL